MLFRSRGDAALSGTELTLVNAVPPEDELDGSQAGRRPPGSGTAGPARGLVLVCLAALLGGTAYMLAPYFVSLVHPGHDGKIFVTALAPLTTTVIVAPLSPEPAVKL